MFVITSYSIHYTKLYDTAVHVAVNNKYIGYILIADEVKEDSAQAIKELKAANIKQTVMLTGDNNRITSYNVCYTKLLR